MLRVVKINSKMLLVGCVYSDVEVVLLEDVVVDDDDNVL